MVTGILVPMLPIPLLLFATWLAYAGWIVMNFGKIRMKWVHRSRSQALRTGILSLISSAVIAFVGVYAIAQSGSSRLATPTTLQWIELDLLGLVFVHLQAYGMIVLMGLALVSPRPVGFSDSLIGEPTKADTASESSHV